MPGLDSQLNSSAPDGRNPAEQAVETQANAEYARGMHHRQIVRRTLVATVIVAIVVLATMIGIPASRHIKTQWFLQAQGVSVDWQLSEDNWTSGGVTSVAFRDQSWFTHSLDSMIPTLSDLMNLESLGLAECPVSEQALQALGRLNRLRELDLTRLHHIRYGFTPGILANSPDGVLTDACLLPLAGLPRLRSLSLQGNRITDKGLEQIGLMAGLEDLDLTATDITDRGLVHLQSLKKLKNVNLSATRATPEGLKALQKAMPTLEISLEIDPELEQKVKAWRMRNP